MHLRKRKYNIIRYFPRLDDNPEQRTTNAIVAVVMLNAEQSTNDTQILAYIGNMHT